MSGLAYKIGADVAGFEQGVNKVTQGLNKLDQASAKTFRNIQNSANQGAFALNSVSQVARDLPFGFIAIQNNLPIVIDQFGALVKTSGGVGGALKSLGAALIGPAGVSFAIGAIISGATALVQKYGSLGEAFRAITGQAASFSDELKKINEDIVKTGDVILNAQGSVIGQKAQVDALIETFGNLNNSTQQRKNALEELGRINKSYFGDLEFEKTTLAELTKRSDEYSQALIQQAIIKGSQSELEKLGPAFAKAAKAYKQAREAYDNATSNLGPTVDEAGNRVIYLDRNVAQLGINLRNAEKDFTLISNQVKEYTTLIKDATNASSNFRPLNTTPKKKPKEKVEVAFEFELASIPPSVERADREIVNEFKKQNVSVPLSLDISIPESASQSLKEFADLASLKLQASLDRAKQFSDALSAQLTESFSNVFSSLGEGIGAVFAGVSSGFSFAQTVLSGLADILINVGKLAISTGVAILGIKKALQSLNPYVAIAAGVALVALGSAVKSKISNNVPKFAEGGIVTRATLGIFGEAGPEAVMPLDKLNDFVKNTNGGGNVQVSGTFALRGNDLYASLRQTQRQQNNSF